MLQWFRKQEMDPKAAQNNGDLHIALTRKVVDFLASQISSPKKASSILAQVARFKELPPNYQEKELPSLYLKLEHYLIEEDQPSKFTLPQLRKMIKYRYEPLMELQHFNLIFESDGLQELRLSQLLFQHIFINASTILGENDEDAFNHMTEWVYRVPAVGEMDAPFNLNRAQFPEETGDWLPVLSRFSHRLFAHLAGLTNEHEATSLYEQSFKELQEIYRTLGTFAAVVQMLPDKLLDANKIGLLTGDQVRTVFLNKVENLKKVNEQISGQNAQLEEAQQELQEAQDTALESVKLFHSVLDTIGEGIVTAGADGNIVMVNQLITNMFGYGEDELIGSPIEKLMPEKYRQQHRAGMERYLNTRESRALGQKLLMEGQKKDRSVFPLEIRINEAIIGEKHFFTASMRDISKGVKQESAHKKTADELRVSEQRYKNLLEMMDDIIFTLSLDGTFTTINEAFAKATGWTSEEWTNRPFTQLIHPDFSMDALKVFQQVLQGEASAKVELGLRTKDDEVMYGRFSLMPQVKNGKMVGALGIARDITLQKLAETSLQNHEGQLDKLKSSAQEESIRYRKLLETSPVGVLVHVDGKVAEINARAIRMLGGQNSEQFDGKPFLSFVHADFRATQKERVLRMLKNGENTGPFEEVMLTVNGSDLPVEVSSSVIQYNGKRAIQMAFRNQQDGAPVDEVQQLLNHQFNELVDSSLHAIFVLDGNGKISRINRHASDLTGIGATEVSGVRFSQLTPKAVMKETEEQLAQLISGELRTFSTRLLRSDSSEFPIEVYSRQITSLNGPTNLLIARDISSEQAYSELNGELTELQKNKSEYVDELERLRAQLEHALKEQRNTDARITDLIAETQIAEQAIEETTGLLEEANNDLEEVTGENRALKGELEQLREQSVELQSLRREANDLNNQLISATEKNKDLESVYHQNEQLRLELAGLKDELAGLRVVEQTNEDLREQLSEAREIGQDRNAIARENDSLQSSLETSQQTISDLREQLNTAREVGEDRNEVARQKESLERNLQTVNQENETLKEDRRDLARANQELRQELEEAKEVGSDRNAIARENDRLKRELEAAREAARDRDSLSKAHQEMKRNLNSARAEAEFSQKRRQELQTELAKLKAELRSTQEEVTARVAQINSTKTNSSIEVMAAQKELEEAEDRLQIAEEKLIRFHSLYEKAQEALDAIMPLVPICSSCKNIRDDQAFWQSLETFVQDEERSAMLKGVCPDCSSRAHVDVTHKSNGSI